MLFRLLSILIAVLTLTITGCGKSFKIVPAEGILTIGGKPAKNINIQFLPDSLRGATGPTSYAITDDEGRFVLKTYEGQLGAVAGYHFVVLADLDEERPAQGQPLKKTPRLDGKYTIAGKGLTAEVVEGGTAILLNVPGSN